MLKSKLNLLSKTLLLTAVALSMFSFSALAEEVVLKAGTAVPMQLVNTVNGKDVAVGQIVDFRVTSDIKVGQTVVIEAGAIARAQVIRAKKNGILGEEGVVQLSVNSVVAVDGTQVILSGGTLTSEGKNKLLLSLFLCFLIKGGEGELPGGMSCNPTVAGSVTIAVE